MERFLCVGHCSKCLGNIREYNKELCPHVYIIAGDRNLFNTLKKLVSAMGKGKIKQDKGFENALEMEESVLY